MAELAKIMLDLAVAVALGGDAACDVALPRAQPGVFGLVASDPTVSRLVARLAGDVDRLPTPRADGDREALRILLGAWRDLSTSHTSQTNRLRALLLGGDDADRAALTDAALAALIRHRGPRDADRAQATRQDELRRLAVAVRDGGRQLKASDGTITIIECKLKANPQIRSRVTTMVTGALQRGSTDRIRRIRRSRMGTRWRTP